MELLASSSICFPTDMADEASSFKTVGPRSAPPTRLPWRAVSCSSALLNPFSVEESIIEQAQVPFQLSSEFEQMVRGFGLSPLDASN